MTVDTEELRRLYAASTQGEWLLDYDRLRQAVVKDREGRVIVESDTYAADIELIVAMHRAVPHLLAELERARMVAGASQVAYEHAIGDHIATLRAVSDHHGSSAEALGKAMSDLRKMTAMVDAVIAERDRLRVQVDRMTPMVEAVERWAKHRYTPGLVAAWERYRDACAKQ